MSMTRHVKLSFDVHLTATDSVKIRILTEQSLLPIRFRTVYVIQNE